MNRNITVLLVGVCTLVGTALASSNAHAQTQTPPPSNPIAFCGPQSPTAPDSWELVFDGQAPEPVAMTPATTPGAATTFCEQNAPAGWTHSFTIPASRFPPRPTPYSVAVRTINAFGANVGATWSVKVGIAPGQFTITAAGQLPE